MGHVEPLEVNSANIEIFRLPRMQRMLNVHIRSRRFGTVKAVARNVSRGGVGCTSKQWLAVGEDMDVELPNIGWVPAMVAWTDGTRFGLAFVCEIDASRVTRDASAGMDHRFQVMDRFRPDTSMRRPGLGLGIL